MSEQPGMDVHVLDGREHALMLAITFEGDLRIFTQLTPAETAETRRAVADMHERRGAAGSN